MVRAIWSGTISFGLVTIPVKLVKATSEKGISFNLIHEKCEGRIEERRWCPTCEEEVEWEELVRGFQFAKNQYVVLDEDDLNKLPLPSKKTVHVTSFVKSEEIDPVYYDQSYYLEPEKGAGNSYALLLESLKKKEMVALGTIALRTKERLCAVRPHGGLLMVETLFYPDEIRVDGSEKATTSKPGEKEMKMANQLIDMMVDKFHPEEHKDHYREALEKVIEAKLEDKEIKIQPERHGSKVIDLAEALQASLAHIKSGGKPTDEDVEEAEEEKPARKTRAGAKRKATAAKRTRGPATGRTKTAAKSKRTTKRGKKTTRRKAS